jgi:nucleoside-diphosphate-sugar epimerase
LPSGVRLAPIKGIDGTTDWTSALAQAQVVVHLAARVHVMAEESDDPLREYRLVNVEGTLNLARQASRSGVKRFIFISSIKVNGEKTLPGQIFRANDTPAPLDPYGVSKLEAEQGLLELAKNTTMEIVIIRPVLIYGPGVKANFLNMMRWIRAGYPLPLGAVKNKRSLVAMDNLVDFIETCIAHPNAANQTFLVSDGEDLSIAELLEKLGNSLNRPARLLPIPLWVLWSGAVIFRKKNIAQRLLESLRVDIEKNNRVLGWQPPVNVTTALDATAKSFLRDNRNED